MDRLDEDIRREAKRIGLPAAGELVRIWPELVGETIAANAWPARVSRSGVLSINTSSATWAFELTHLGGEILSRLKERLGEECPRELRFTPGPVPARGRERTAFGRSGGPQVGPAEALQAEQVAAPIENEELRTLVARAAAASLARSTRK